MSWNFFKIDSFSLLCVPCSFEFAFSFSLCFLVLSKDTFKSLYCFLQRQPNVLYVYTLIYICTNFFPVLVDGMTFLEMENTSFIATMRETLRYEASFEQLMNYKRTVMG